MAVVAIVKERTNREKVDAYSLFTPKDGGGYTLNAEYVWKGKTYSGTATLDDQYRPVGVEDAMICASFWNRNQTRFTKVSKDNLRFRWSACSAHTFKRLTSIAGNKGYASQHPTTLAREVNTNKRGDEYFI